MKKVLVLLLLIGFTPIWAHEYHVAIIEVEHNSDSSSLEIAIKLTTADINAVVKNKHGKTIGIGTDNELTNGDSILMDYILKNFSLSMDSTTLQMNPVGYENEEEYTWAYLEIKDVNSCNALKVHSTLLLELRDPGHGHSHQSTLINVRANGKVKSAYLNDHRRKTEFIF